MGESYRATLAGRTPDGDTMTLIVTRQPGHRRGPVWLSFGTTVASTIALPDRDAGELTGLLVAARAAGGTKGPAPGPSRAAVGAALAQLDGQVMATVLQAAYEIDWAAAL